MVWCIHMNVYICMSILLCYIPFFFGLQSNVLNKKNGALRLYRVKSWIKQTHLHVQYLRRCKVKSALGPWVQSKRKMLKMQCYSVTLSAASCVCGISTALIIGYSPRLLSYQTCLDTKPVLYQVRFCIFHRSYKTGFVPKWVNTKPA